MNVENIKRVRDHIASLPPERFDMRIYGGRKLPNGGVEEDKEVDLADCGTAACICGWTVTLLGLDCELGDDGAAGAALGLSYSDAWSLFIPDDLGRRTREQAVSVLDHLMATGEVAWPVFDMEGDDF